MEENSFLRKAGEIFAYVEEYFDSRLELLKLQGAEKVARIGAIFVSMLIVGFLVFLLFLFLLVTLVLVLGDFLDSYTKAFAWVSLGLFVLIVVLIVLRKKLIELPLINNIIRKLYE